MGKQRARLAFGRREMTATAVGILVYFVLQAMTLAFSDVREQRPEVRPAVVVPIVIGAVYGPIPGFLSGVVGNLLGDWVYGDVPHQVPYPTGNQLIDWLSSYYVHWQIGTGITGLIPGIGALFGRRYRAWKSQVRTVLLALLAVVIGNAFGSIMDPVMGDMALNASIEERFVPFVLLNSFQVIVLFPIFLYHYSQHEDLSFLNLNWMRSLLIRRFVISNIISIGLPFVYLLYVLVDSLLDLVTPKEQVLGQIDHIAFRFLFPLILAVVIIISNMFLAGISVTRPLRRVTEAADLMERNDLSLDQAIELRSTPGGDEISQLSQQFGRMAEEVILREQRLRQHVEELKIEINQTKKEREVEEITGSEYFEQLRQRVTQLRARPRRGGPAAPSSPSA